LSREIPDDIGKFPPAPPGCQLLSSDNGALWSSLDRNDNTERADLACGRLHDGTLRPDPEVPILSFLGSAFLAGFLLLVSVSVAKFLVVPAVRWMLVSGFQALSGEEGFLRTVRQLLSYPVRALLSRQRKARHGDSDSEFELFLVDVGFGVLISSVIQGFWLTVLTVCCVFVLVAIGVAVADL
jgi:hypothetical protein